MISDHFDERQLKQLLEVAAIAMANGDLIKELNMEDPLMAELQDELTLFLELEADRLDDEDEDEDQIEETEDEAFGFRRSFALD